MKTLLCLTILVFFSANICFSQTNSAKRLTNEAGGYSFVEPENFTSEKNDEGFAFANQSKTILLLVKNHNFQNFLKFSEQANIEKDGFQMVGKIQDLGGESKTFRVTKQTPQGWLVVDTFVMFSPFGGGTLIVAFSDTANAEPAFNSALKISRSLTFTKPQTSALALQIKTLLGGKHLLYLYTGNGYSERTDIYLCSSGEFVFRNDASSSSALGTGAIAGNGDGRWTISNNANSLILQFNNGRTNEYVLSARQASNEIGLNGKRFFVTNQNLCR